MSLVGAYGNWKNDLDTIVLRHRELLKLSSAPLIIYKQKEKSQQTKKDNLYGEYTEKLYERGIELRGFFSNPTLVQELIKMGLDMPEKITVNFSSLEMYKKLGRPLMIYDLIQVPHQRRQFYIVMNTYPNPEGEVFFKNIEWMVIASKEELAGLVFPEWITMDGILSWFTVGEHYRTEFLQDRMAYLEPRKCIINGNIDYFWKQGDFWEEIEIGNLNGTDNYIDLSDNYNFTNKSFTIQLFIKISLQDLTSDKVIFRKGENLQMILGQDKKIKIKFNNLEISSVNAVVTDENWTMLTFVVDNTNKKIYLYKNKNNIPLTISNYNFIFMDGLTDDLTIGGDKNLSVENYLKGKISNIFIYEIPLNQNQINNNYDNLITRNFYQIQ